MAKRSRADLSLEAINLVFDRLFAVADTSNAADDTLGILKRLKDQMLSELAEEEVATHTEQAKEFTLNEAVEAFGLTYSTKMSDYKEKHHWKIEALPDVKPFQPSECFRKVSPWIFMNRAMTGGLARVISGQLHWNLQPIK